VKTVPSRPLVAGVAATALLAGTMGTAHAITAKRPRAAAPVAAAVPARTGVTAPVRPMATPRWYRLKLQEQYQSTNYYCVPASSSMSLSTFGVKVDQGTLAKKMRTTTKGTGINSAASVIAGYIHPRRYDDKVVGDVVDHPTVLMDRVAYDVGSLRRAPVIQVWMEKLPWNKGKVVGRSIGHAIIAYGYDKSTGTITVFDPWRPTGGTHTLAASALARTLQAGAGMHYISRL
jgi:hypothetical protein